MKAQETIKFALHFAIAVLTGCVPVVYTTVPQISGRVVDASGASLKNAVVKVLGDLIIPLPAHRPVSEN